MKPEEIKEIQRRSFERLGKGLDHGVEFRLCGDTTWVTPREREDGSAELCYLNTGFEYRIRPDTVNVFGVELPDWRGRNQEHEITYSFQSSEALIKWQEFFSGCMTGKYAQKPKNKVTADQIKAILYLRPAENAAQKIIDLFERAE